MLISIPAPSLAGETPLSAARRVYTSLRTRIIEMRMPPGERIVERDIANEFGTSRTPVHEAVQRLADEGLVDVVPRVGTFVARIPVEALDEAMVVRAALEGAIIEKATERATPEGIARLRAILDAQAEHVRNDDTRGFHRTDEAFHATLAELSGYPGIWPVIQQTKTQLDRFRQLTLPIDGRMRDVIGEHLAVLDALAKGDPADAVTAMRGHLDQVLPALETLRELWPDYFTSRAAVVAPPPNVVYL